MKSKRGQGLPMNSIVIAAIVLVVMIVLIMIFSGSMGNWLVSLKNETEGKDCGTYHGADQSHTGTWTVGSCPSGHVPIYNTADADTHPGQTCCLDKS